MSKKASICIIAILMGSGLLAAYHADTRSTARNSIQQMQYQDKDLAQNTTVQTSLKVKKAADLKIGV